MQISLPRADLARVLTAVTRVVEARNTIPILSNVLLTVEGGKLTVKGTDLDIEASASVQALDATDGAITVPAKTLADIVKKAPGNVSMALEGDMLVIKSGRSLYKLRTLPAGDYPSIADEEFDVEFDIDLAALVAPVSFAISTEERRYYLNGVFLRGTEDSLTAVATDGHRLARHVGAAAATFDGVILPRKLVALLPKGMVKVAISDRKVRITTPDAVLTSKLIDGTFPDYTRVIPTANDNKMVVDRDTLVSAVERVTVVSDRGSGVKLSVSADGLVLSVKDEARDEVEVEWAGAEGPFEIGFNGLYLAEALRTFAPGDVTLAFNDAGSPALLTGADDGLDMVLMPYRVA